MTETVEQLKSQLQQLPASDRVDLACFLLGSLEPEESGVEEAWDAEVARRVAEIRSGQVAGKPAEQLFAELRERYP
jgi:putative addiction module component (TIGR02574 family)